MLTFAIVASESPAVVAGSTFTNIARASEYLARGRAGAPLHGLAVDVAVTVNGGHAHVTRVTLTTDPASADLRSRPWV